MYYQYNINGQSVDTPATLTDIQYSCQVINNVVKTTVIQTFSSKKSDEFCETQYLFPVMDDICLQSFSASYKDQTIKGMIKGKAEAKLEYEQNKAEGNLVSYAELQRDSLEDYIKIKLGNLPPNEVVNITLTYSQQLNTYLNKYYVVDIPIQNASDIFKAKLGQNILKLDISCTGRILYAEQTAKLAERTINDEFNAQFTINSINNEDHFHFRVLFSYEGMFEPQVIYGNSAIFCEDSVKSAIIPARQSAMVTFLPDFNRKVTQELDDTLKASQTKGEDILSNLFEERVSDELIDHLNSSRSEFIFLLDRSGSMRGKPLEKAIEALTLFLQSLPNDSYFNVISFGRNSLKLYENSQKYNSQTLKFATQKISKFIANMGGTEIYTPLQMIFMDRRIRGYNKQIFVLTDGGVDNSQNVIQLIKRNNKQNRVHLIGFGNDADKHLIQESAIAGKGIYQLTSFNQDLSAVIIKMLCQTITPTLDSISVAYDQSVFESIYPNKIPCVFKDEAFNLHLFLNPLVKIEELTDEQKTITLKYTDSSLKEEVTKQIRLDSNDTFVCNSELRESVFKLGKQLQLNEGFLCPESNILQNNLVQQSIDYQLLTAETALICVIEKINDESKAVYSSLPHVIYTHKQLFNQVWSENIQSSNRLMRKSAAMTFCAPNLEKKSMNVTRGDANSIQSSNKPIASCRPANSLSSSQSSIGLINPPNSSAQKRPISALLSNSQRKDTNTMKLKEVKKQKEDVSEEKEECKMNENAKELEIEQKQSKYCKLELLISLADSSGVWKYDELLIKKFISSQLQSVISLGKMIKDKDVFMTLFIICILQKFYSGQKQKWILISKKSNSSVKDAMESDIFNSTKQSITNILASIE